MQIYLISSNEFRNLGKFWNLWEYSKKNHSKDSERSNQKDSEKTLHKNKHKIPKATYL